MSPEPITKTFTAIIRIQTI